jgi:CheY-like chemotaxis protein
MTTLLIVEDNPGDVEIIHLALEAVGCPATVETAASGEEALRRLARGGAADLPDLVLLDLHLGAMDGMEVLDRIRENPCWDDLRVVIFTTSARESERKACLAAGATDYWTKPAKWEGFTRIADQVAALLTRARAAAKPGC